MFFKKRKRLSYKEERVCEIRKSYNDIVNIAEANISNRTVEEQLMILDYLIESISDEICASTVNELLTKNPNILFPPFPETYLDEYGECCELRLNKKRLVDLSEVKVYVRPWDLDRLFRNLISIKDNDFKYDINNHYSIFYSDINFCYVYNGNHSINAGRYFKKGEILSEEYDMSCLYLNCKTDGLKWYDIHSGKVLYDVQDFRLAAIFTLAKLRYNIKTAAYHNAAV